MKKIIYLILLSCVSFNAYSKETFKDSVQLEDVVVTGSKFETSRKLVPLSVSQISAENIKQSGQYNVLTTLSTYVPGVFITERNILGFGVAAGGSGTINVRGVGSSPNTQVLVLIDGHPQYQGIFGHPLPDAYVASDVEKVEVIRGPASVLYGSNAMAGAINIITKKQQAEGLSATLNAVYGSYNTQKYAGTFGIKKDRLSLFVSANYGKTEGIRENTDFDIGNGYLKAGYDLNPNWKITADVSLAQYEANDNGPVQAPAPFNIDVFRGKAALSVENKYNRLDGAVKLYHNFGEHAFSDGFQSTDRNSGLMIYQNYRLFSNTHITAGFDAKKFGGQANGGMAANTLKTVNELAGYTLIRQKLLEIVDLNAGLRFEHNSVFGNEWVPMTGVAVRAGETTNFKASVSKGFRSPTVMELYLYAPNEELKPERMMNYDISWLQSFLGHQLNTELTLFLAEGENIIQVVGGMPPMRQNVGSFSNRGIEFAAKYRVTNQLNVQANYTFLDMEKTIVAAPKHQFNINLNYQYKILNFNVSAQHVNELYASISPENIQNFTLLNARISAKVTKPFEVFISGHNLLNQQYQINNGYPMSGINFHGGFNYQL
ncbi:MAG: TonB-dependent receptor [Paludibacter sp.]|nr:TonB-dependent receptor [Paludibacter sp.]